MAQSSRVQLLDLPNELVLRIIQSIDDKWALYSACRVNHLFRTYAEPLIGLDYLVTSSEEGRWAIGKISQHPRRAQQITSLTVAYPERVHERGPSFFPIISKMKRIESLVIEATDVPPDQRVQATQARYPNEQEEVTRLFRNASLLRQPGERILRQLRSCEVQFLYDDHNLWDLASFYVIFLHPALQRLVLSCGGWPYAEGNVLKQVEYQDIIQILTKHSRSTNLQDLTFEQCDVNLYALKAILGVPKALKHLNIHECRHYHHPSGWSTQKRTLYVEALLPQHATLETLSISLSSIGHGLSLYSDLVDWSPFTMLHSVAVSPIQILTGKYSSDNDRLPPENSLPPNLETIRIWDLGIFSDHGLVNIARLKRSLGMPNLNLIHYELSSLSRYTQDPQPHYHHHPGAIISTMGSLQQQIKRLATALRPHGVRLVVESLIRISSHIPPYLHNETRARRSLMFDSETYQLESDEQREARWRQLDEESYVRRRHQQ